MTHLFEKEGDMTNEEIDAVAERLLKTEIGHDEDCLGPLSEDDRKTVWKRAHDILFSDIERQS